MCTVIKSLLISIRLCDNDTRLVSRWLYLKMGISNNMVKDLKLKQTGNTFNKIHHSMVNKSFTPHNEHNIRS